ncbi:hypothetical protein [Pseudorhodoferax sp. Leaf267]|uniref:hypothetical protein n=1 Tax=Pseudorhodoferax sp. Leaf267 TaxID=1736316 RepID=UPI001F2A82E9|nr:hypothetical protein [Pseudorhodoferax sp. Leaf267]
MPTRPPFGLNLRSYAADGSAGRHDFAQLVLPVAGRLQGDIGGREQVLREGQDAFVAPGMRHAQTGQGAHRALVLDLDDTQLGAAAPAARARVAGPLSGQSPSWPWRSATRTRTH